jgi:hypothetical protein
MARPALIIGLGGTGQEIVRFLKKELLEIGEGKMPEEVRLLAFDTASLIDPDEGAVESDKVELKGLGNVVLEENTEYVCIGDALYDIAMDIKCDQDRVKQGGEAEIPHLHWFPADELEAKNTPMSAYNTKQGAGALRPMGRLSLFKNVYSVLGHLGQAMNKLKDTNKITGSREGVVQGKDAKILEIIIVGSLAGGTGAGTLVDMAWLARAQANAILRDKYAIRGFFLMPTTFIEGGLGGDKTDKGKQGRGFAAWHELDRAMISGGSGDSIVYNPSDSTLNISCNTSAYDITYLIDPDRPSYPIFPPPDEGIFPGVAHLISFIIDDDAGVKYTENLINLLLELRSTLPRGVYHSSIGGYTLKVPVYYTKAQFSHKLAKEVLDELLKPVKNEQDRVMHISQLDNQEVGEATSGLQACVGFLTGDMLRIRDKTIPNTKLLQTIGQARARKIRENGAYIKEVAEGRLTTQLQDYFNALNQITEYDEEQGKIITNDITGELQWKIWNECPPSRARPGETPAAAWARLTSDAFDKSVPSVSKRRFGVETATKSSGSRLRGEFGKELLVPAKSQIQRCKDLLEAQTLKTLNGTDPDARIARGGKLGYIRGFYKELSDTFAYFRNFLDDVRTVRSQEAKLAQKTQHAAEEALKRYDHLKNKSCWLTFWDNNVHPDAHQAQQTWLKAVQLDIDRRRGDILLDVLDETVSDLKSYADKTLEEIDSWIEHLATGEPNFNIESLYERLTVSLDGVESLHALDKRLGNPNFQTEQALAKVSQIITEHTYQPDEIMLKDSLAEIHWVTQPDANEMKIQCIVGTQELRRSGENPAGDNLRTILELTNRPYAVVNKDHPIVTEIEEVYHSGEELESALHGHAEPFYRFKNGEVPPQTKQAFLRVNDRNNPSMQEYFDIDFLPKYRDANPEIAKAFKVNSSDKYKISLVRSDDLMPSESFVQYWDCFKLYKGLFGPQSSREIHVFPEEQNAAYYEFEMPKELRQNYRLLRPEVVSLLKDRQKFELFFESYALGLVAIMEGEDNGLKHRFWGYQLSENEEPIYLTPINSQGSRPSHFDVIKNFIIGQDKRQGFDETFRINWKDLQNKIGQRIQEIGIDQAIALYEKQLDDKPESIIKAILDEKQTDKALSGGDKYQQQIMISQQKYQDLADLAKYIYISAANKIRGNSW